MPVSPEGRPAWLSHPPFYDWLGATLLQLGSGRCVLRLEPRGALGNSKGDIHGGATASLLDIAMSQAVRSSYADRVNVSTISLTINYLATAAGAIQATAVALRPGATIAHAEVEATDLQGQAVARATAIYRIIRAKS